MPPEMLEVLVDKFVFRAPGDRRYSADGLWIRRENGRARVGASDFFQQVNGDMAFVTVRPVGAALRAGEPFVRVETIKVTLDAPAPVSGVVVEVNAALDLHPELVNQDPYGAGWLAVFELADPDAGGAELLDAERHLALVRRQAEEELRKR